MKQPTTATSYALGDTDEVSLDQVLQEAGYDAQTVKAEAKREADDELIKRIKESDDSIAKLTPEQQAALNIGTGVALSFREIGKNIYNGAVGVADLLDNYAASKGLGKGDIITQDNKWTDPLGARVSESLDYEGQVAKKITDFAVPLAAGLSVGGVGVRGVLAGMAADSAYNFFAIDPKDARLSDLLKDTWAKEIPAVSDAIDYLSTKPTDDEFTARTKNALEGAGFGVPFLMVSLVTKASRAYTRITAARAARSMDDLARVAEATPTPTAVENVPANTLEKMQAEQGIGTKPNPTIPKEAGPQVVEEVDGEDVATLSNQLRDLFQNPSQPELPKNRALDNILDENGVLKKGASFTDIPTAIKDLPTTSVNVNGEVYTITPSFSKETNTIKLSLTDAQGKQRASLFLGLESKSLQSNELQLVPSMIRSDGNKGTAGLPVELLRYTREYIGQVQPSQILTPKGRAFTRRTLQREAHAAAKAADTEQVLFDDWAINILEGDKAPEGITTSKVLGNTTPPKDTPEQLSLFEQQYTQVEDSLPKTAVEVDNTTGAIRLDLTNDNLMEKLYEVAQAIPSNVLYTPMTAEELVTAANILKNDPATTTRILNYQQGQGVFTAEETLVANYMLQTAEKAIGEAANMVDIANPASMVTWGRQLEAYQRMVDIRQGSASAKGASLKAEQALAQIAGLDPLAALKDLGTKGRARLYQRLVEKYGGAEVLADIAQNTKFVEEFIKIKNMPDTAFRQIGDEVHEASKFWGFQKGLTKVLLNNYLWSPKTWVRAAFGTAFTTSKQVIDNYISAGIQLDKQALHEANQYVLGMMQGMMDTYRAARSNGAGAIKKSINLDYADGLYTGRTLEEKAIDGTLSFGLRNGFDAVTTIPTKVLSGIDSVANSINERAYTYQEVARLMKKNPELTVEQATQILEKNPVFKYNRNQFARTMTFSKNLSGVAESIDNGITIAANKYSPLVRVVVPFFRTSINGAEYVLKNSPMAVLAPGVRKAIANGGRDRAEALSKMISGSAIIGGATYLAATDQIKGEDTFNPNLKGVMYGIKGKSVPQGPAIKVGDEWYSVKGLEPLATMVEVGATLAKLGGNVSQEEYEEAIYSATAVLGETLTPEMLTDNMINLTKIMDGDFSVLGTYTSNMATALVPNIVPNIAREVDPYVRATTSPQEGIAGWKESLMYKYQNRIPWFSKDLPAQRNLFGQKIAVPDGLGPDVISPISVSSGKGLPMKEALERIMLFSEKRKGDVVKPPNLRISLPSKDIEAYTNGPTYRMDNYEYELLQIASAGIHPTTGQLLDPNGDLYDQWDATLKRWDFYNKTPDTMEKAEYNMMVAELQRSYIRLQNIGLKTFKDIPEVRMKLEDLKRMYDTDQAIKGQY